MIAPENRPKCTALTLIIAVPVFASLLLIHSSYVDEYAREASKPPHRTISKTTHLEILRENGINHQLMSSNENEHEREKKFPNLKNILYSDGTSLSSSGDDSALHLQNKDTVFQRNFNDMTRHESSHEGTQPEFSASIYTSSRVVGLNHFWESTGFCPPDPHRRACEWFLSDDMLHNLAYMGSVPHSGIKNVRIHLLLDAVYVEKFDAGGNPAYNFTCLDEFIDRLHDNGLKPGFELMGNPSDYFTDLENKTQVYQWKSLVHQVAQRYIEKYGLEYVSTWNFESWNEPSIRSFDGLNFTYTGFLNYYDACSEGLREASPCLRLGAPSGGCHDNYTLKRYCWVLLNHIASGRNYFTGNRVRANYISIHKKGWGPNNSAVIMNRELHFQALLQKHLPGLVGTPLVNDEGDPLVTWSKPLSWRADVRYAGMVAKVINRHQKKYFVANSTGINFEMLSNDNGFLSYQPHPFSQRTLLARFQVNNTDPPHVQFIRKPGHSVMGLLSLLGDQEVRTDIHTTDFDGSLGILSTIHVPNNLSVQQDSWQMASLVYYSIDTRNVSIVSKRRLPAKINLKLDIKDLPSMEMKDIKYVIYMLDERHGNPWRIWRESRSPKTPSHDVLANMRDNQDAIRVAGPETVVLSAEGSFIVRQDVSLPSVFLIHLCVKSLQPPDQVTNVVVHEVTCNQVLVVWSDSCVNTKCILRYDVEYSASNDLGTFVKVNPVDSIFTIFHYAPNVQDLRSRDLVQGYYRVRAVDYWGRPGEYSLVVHH